MSVLSAHSTRSLLPAIRSRADLNRDGHVSQQELSRFVARHGADRIALGVERAMAAALDATWGSAAEDLPPTRSALAPPACSRCLIKLTWRSRSAVVAPSYLCATNCGLPHLLS